MKVASLDARARLRGPGLRLRTGPLLNCIRSPLEAVAQGIGLLYAEHPVEDDGFADFQLAIAPPRGLRRWWRPQVVFCHDGEAPFHPLPAGQGFPLLEWALNWCVTGLMPRWLTLHAAVLERNGRALVLPAPSGSGKSTLCAGLLFHGWRLLSDELTLIDPATGLIQPLPRPVSLKNASIEAIGRFVPEARFSAPVHDTMKGTVAHLRPPADAVARAHEPARPGWIVLPRYVAGQDARLEPLPRARAFMQLVENAFNYHVHGAAGFDALADLVEHSGCFAFSYSRLDEAVAVFERLAADAGAAP